MIGCGDGARNAPDVGAAPPDPPAAGIAGPDTVLFIGTSLTAGLGVAPERAYPAVIQAKIDSAGLPFHVVNAGVSGETSAAALRRLDWLLRQPFHVVVIETGANDMLRGTDLDTTYANIQSIIDRVREARPDARVVLVGMLAPPNLGRAYAQRYGEIYRRLAERNDLPFVPFLLDGVGGVPALNQSDGIHPTAEGHRVLARNVWDVLEPELRAAMEPRG